nr:hypothetical protein [Mesorhizobium sp. M5C.F.Ca.IN.020.29.1.1]
MFDGKLAYDAVAFKAAAGTLRTRTGPALIAEFPSATLGPPRAPGWKSTRPVRNSRRWPVTSGRWRAHWRPRPSGRPPVSPTT